MYQKRNVNDMVYSPCGKLLSDLLCYLCTYLYYVLLQLKSLAKNIIGSKG